MQASGDQEIHVEIDEGDDLDTVSKAIDEYEDKVRGKTRKAIALWFFLGILAGLMMGMVIADALVRHARTEHCR
jgi:hypothetical protein